MWKRLKSALWAALCVMGATTEICYGQDIGVGIAVLAFVGLFIEILTGRDG